MVTSVGNQEHFRVTLETLEEEIQDLQVKLQMATFRNESEKKRTENELQPIAE